MGSIHQKFARKKVGDTEKRAKHWVHSPCSEMNVVRSFDRSFFSVQTSRVAGRLPFFWVEPEFDISKSHRNGVAPGGTNRREKWTASSLGDRKGRWSPNTLPATRLTVRDRQVPGSHRNRSTACQSETLPWITMWRRTVAKGRNFERSGRGLQGSSRNIPFDSCVCSVQVCGLAGVWNFRFGDFPQAQVFFPRAPSRTWRGRPHLRWLWTPWAPKNLALLPLAQWPEALKATTLSIVEQMTSQSRWTPRLFLLKKKSSKSPQRKRKEKRKEQRKWMKKKKERKGNNN